MTGRNEYGNALFMLAREEGTVEAVRDDAEAAYTALKLNPEYIKLLDTPAVSKEEKISLIDKAFSSLHYSVTNLLKMLCEKHSVHTFREVYLTYSALYDEFMGIERVEALTAIKLSPEKERAISEKLAKMTGKRIVLRNTVNPEILGGVILRFSGTQIDGSVKSRLDAFSESLKNINL